MTTTFFSLLIGDANAKYRTELVSELERRTGALADCGDALAICNQEGLPTPVPAEDAVAVVFCRKPMDAAEIEAINACVARGTPIIPVVEDLARFTTVTPDEVSRFNGFQLSDTRDVGELAGLVLELIGLQRAKRKIFISYARADSSAIAAQLRLAFMQRWYSVFLDSISIRPGVLFQNNLPEELADSDVVVFLDSPNARGRKYVDEELAFAGNAGLGGLQVVWPGLARSREGSLFTMMKLDQDDLDDELGVTRLASTTVMRILRQDRGGRKGAGRWRRRKAEGDSPRGLLRHDRRDVDRRHSGARARHGPAGERHSRLLRAARPLGQGQAHHQSVDVRSGAGDDRAHQQPGDARAGVARRPDAGARHGKPR